MVGLSTRTGIALYMKSFHVLEYVGGCLAGVDYKSI